MLFRSTISWTLLSMAMTERVERTVRPDGIYINKVRYWDSCLARIIGERVVVRTFQDNMDTVSVFHGQEYMGTVPRAENFRMIGEDPEKIARFMEVARGARKSRIQQLRVARDRVRVVLDRAMEVPDLSNPAVITGLVQERMAQDRKELEDKAVQRQQTARRKEDPFLRRRIAEGEKLLDLIG